MPYRLRVYPMAESLHRRVPDEDSAIVAPNTHILLLKGGGTADVSIITQALPPNVPHVRPMLRESRDVIDNEKPTKCRLKCKSI